MGVAGALTRRHLEGPRGEQFGRALEHLVFLEPCAHGSYGGLAYPISFWRTKAGQEVEVKGGPRVDDRDLRALASFAGEHKPRASYVICCEPVTRKVGDILVVPWRSFFESLWAGEVIRSRLAGRPAGWRGQGQALAARALSSFAFRSCTCRLPSG